MKTRTSVCIVAALFVAAVLLTSGCGGKDGGNAAKPAAATKAATQTASNAPNAATKDAAAQKPAQAPAEAKGKAAQPAKPAAPAKSDAKAKAPAPKKPVPKKAAPTGPALPAMESYTNVWLTANGSFDQWLNNVPVYWKASSPDEIKKSTEGKDGRTAVAILEAQGQRWAGLRYEIKADKEVLGGTLRATISGKAATAGALRLSAGYTVGGKAQSKKTYHPGDGKWHTMSLEAEIPDGADPASLVVIVCRDPGKKGEILVDNAGIIITKGAKKDSYPQATPRLEATAKQYVLNGSFETWTAGAPDFWMASNRPGVKRAKQAFAGDTAVELSKGEAKDAMTGLAYQFSKKIDLAGTKLEASILGKASAPGLLAFAVGYSVKDKWTWKRTFHSGDKEWHTLQLKVDIPKDADAGSVTVRAYRVAGKDGTAEVDMAKVVKAK